MDWANVLNDACTAVLTIGVMIGAAKKWPGLFKAIAFVGEHAGEVVKDAEVIIKDIAATPAGAVIKHQLQAEVDKVSAQLRDSELARLALVGLHGFGLAVDGLSDTQRVALVQFIKDSAPAAWNVKDQEVENVLTAVQKAASNFASLELVKAANVFTAAAQKPVAAQ